MVCSNSWQFRPWILSLLSAHTQHLDALCSDCLTFSAAPPHQSSQPGVQSVQAPSVLRSQSSMHQPNVFTPSWLKPPPLPMPRSDGWLTVVSKSAHGNSHIRGARQRRIGHPLAHQRVRKQTPQSVDQWLLPFSHTVRPHASRTRHSSTSFRPCPPFHTKKLANDIAQGVHWGGICKRDPKALMKVVE